MAAQPYRLLPAALLLPAFLAACGGDSPSEPPPIEPPPVTDPVALPTLGLGEVAERNTSELWVHGSYAYTGTHGFRNGVPGNVIKIWDVSGNTPVLLDSLAITEDPPAAPSPSGAPGPRFHGEPGEHDDDGHEHGAGPNRIGDIQVSDDGSLLVAATEGGPGSILVYSLADPRRPVLLTRYATENTAPGVHTAQVSRVNGRLYGFLSINPAQDVPARLVIVDLGDPRAPREVWSRPMGAPYQHDVFVRDGILFTAMWHDGVGIWDIGGGGRGGSIENPVQISSLQTVNGHAHNVWWVHDQATGSRRWLLVGEERPTNGRYRGDVHVVDVSDLAAPREVAFFTLDSGGAHNFAVDEQRGILYSAFYTSGVRAIDVRGDLGSCAAAQRSADGRCNLGLMNRQVGIALGDAGRPLMVWGVHVAGNRLYASDMPNGLWKIDISPLR